MLSSVDWAILVTLRKELENIKALYTNPPKDLIPVITWLTQRIKEMEMKDNDS